MADRLTLAESPDGTRERLAATVAALRSAATYPGEVSKVETIETHMSWVFLTDAHAWKLKKPVRTAMLDNTTLEARRRGCEMEFTLNRRLSPTVYLAVVPVVITDGTARVQVAGAPSDWLVKMRRLPADRMLDACIARQSVSSADIDRLAGTLARFYADAERVPEDGGAYRRRIALDIAAKGASVAQAHYGLPAADVDAAVAGLEGWLARHGELLEARGARVVDAHGDLRQEHICLEEPGPVVIDSLEFSRELRLLDPLSELSFFSLECRRLGAGWIGDQLIAACAERMEDRAPAPLVAFYKGYHALVRAAVAIWHLDDGGLEHSDAWRERALWYLRVAREVA
jgi:aminoglycoside phosphotransferase family enzyme